MSENIDLNEKKQYIQKENNEINNLCNLADDFRYKELVNKYMDLFYMSSKLKAEHIRNPESCKDIYVDDFNNALLLINRIRFNLHNFLGKKYPLDSFKIIVGDNIEIHNIERDGNEQYCFGYITESKEKLNKAKVLITYKKNTQDLKKLKINGVDSECLDYLEMQYLAKDNPQTIIFNKYVPEGKQIVTFKWSDKINKDRPFLLVKK